LIQGLKKGPFTAEEDALLKQRVDEWGELVVMMMMMMKKVIMMVMMMMMIMVKAEEEFDDYPVPYL